MEPPSPQTLYTRNGFFWNSELEEFVEMYWDTVFDYVRAGGGKPTWAAFNPQKMIQLGRHGSYDEMFDDLQAIVGEDVAPVGSANGNNLDLFLSESGILIASAENLALCWDDFLHWKHAVPLLVGGSEPRLITQPRR